MRDAARGSFLCSQCSELSPALPCSGNPVKAEIEAEGAESYHSFMYTTRMKKNQPKSLTMFAFWEKLELLRSCVPGLISVP